MNFWSGAGFWGVVSERIVVLRAWAECGGGSDRFQAAARRVVGGFMCWKARNWMTVRSFSSCRAFADSL